MADKSTIQYKCPNCGGALKFSSKAQKMKCPNCDTEFKLKDLKAYDDILKKESNDDISWNTTKISEEWGADETGGMSIYHCESCGGELVGDENTAATSCPFCGSPVVIAGRLEGVLRPELVIPFKLDKEAAKAGFRKHLEGKRLLPKAFKTGSHIDEVKGIYVPFWLFDAKANADIRYEATRDRFWSDDKYDYIETSYYAVLRSGQLKFEKIPVDASSKIENDLTESLEPYRFDEAVDFQTAYLAGYLADKYDVSADDSVGRANERVKASTEKVFEETVQGYDSVVPEHSSVQIKGGKVRYVLLPVWTLSTRWKGENYLFAMNGQTGKFVGNLPMDKGIYYKWLFSLTAIFSVILVILSYFVLY